MNFWAQAGPFVLTGKSGFGHWPDETSTYILFLVCPLFPSQFLLCHSLNCCPPPTCCIRGKATFPAIFLQPAPDQWLCVQLIKNAKGDHHLGSLFGFQNLLVFPCLNNLLHWKKGPSIHCPWPMPSLGHLGMQISLPSRTDIAVHEYCNVYSASHPIQLCLSLHTYLELQIASSS